MRIKMSRTTAIKMPWPTWRTFALATLQNRSLTSMVWFPMRFELEKMILVKAAIDEEEDGLSCTTMRNQMVIDENSLEEYKDNRAVSGWNQPGCPGTT